MRQGGLVAVEGLGATDLKSARVRISTLPKRRPTGGVCLTSDRPRRRVELFLQADRREPIGVLFVQGLNLAFQCQRAIKVAYE